MTKGAVLIAALAGRALAASARRAGYAPLVADAFGDTDTTEQAAAAICVRDAARIGFRTKPTLAALAALAERAPQPPVGLVLGSGFEDRPKLVAALARHYRLLGNDAATIARCKDPAILSALLDHLSIPHPETRIEPPQHLEGWLTKRIGGSGGSHIEPAVPERNPRRYFQRRLEGTPHALLAVAAAGATHVVGISRQWTVEGGPHPYRYGGAVGPAEPPAAVADAMRAAALKLSSAFGLVGLIAFDFLIVAGTPYLLEVNPRPSATLDVFDDAAGTLFEAHIAACTGAPISIPAMHGARAAGVLYADKGALPIGDVTWPDWVADRPAPGTRVPRYRPIATVFAAAPAADAALGSCRQRLDELGDMLYAQARNRERNDNAAVHRSGPQRLRPRDQAR